MHVGCGIRLPINNATLTDMILPEDSVIGIEEGVNLFYTCHDRNHWNGATLIISECNIDGTWTNLDAVCRHGKF